MKKLKSPVFSEAESYRLGTPGWSSRGYLPHYHEAGVTQHVTFRLADSLPVAVIETWQDELRLLPESDALKEKYKRVEQYLDEGHGVCWLQDAGIAEIVQNALLYFAGERYDLTAWCIMPNHVHTLFTPLGEWHWQKIVGSWQSFTANECNQRLARTGQFWQREPFDRYIRNEEHFQNVIRYIERNPVKAGLCATPEDWQWSSAWARQHPAGNA
jgi:REP element-mobilizing transposase RayT